METTGIVRRVDNLGRIVIPQKICRTLHIREGDPLEINTSKASDIILDNSPVGELQEFSTQMGDAIGSTTGGIAAVANRNFIIIIAAVLIIIKIQFSDTVSLACSRIWIQSKCGNGCLRVSYIIINPAAKLPGLMIRGCNIGKDN